MKRYLLDTHVWIWSLVEPSRLKAKVCKELEDHQNELWLSPITVWEAVLLGEKKKVDMIPDPNQWVKKALQKTPCKEALFNHEIALLSRKLKFHHEDPADRFLAATAIAYDLVLITADQKLWKCKDITCLKA